MKKQRKEICFGSLRGTATTIQKKKQEPVRQVPAKTSHWYLQPLNHSTLQSYVRFLAFDVVHRKQV